MGGGTKIWGGFGVVFVFLLSLVHEKNPKEFPPQNEKFLN